MRIDEIVKRYHFNAGTSDKFAHSVTNPKDENQLVRDIHYLIKLAVDVRKEILNCLTGIVS